MVHVICFDHIFGLPFFRSGFTGKSDFVFTTPLPLDHNRYIRVLTSSSRETVVTPNTRVYGTDRRARYDARSHVAVSR